MRPLSQPMAEADEGRELGAPPAVSAAWPRRGPCGFCGFRDARHRIFDTVLDRHRGGDSARLLADAYDVSEVAVRQLLAWWAGHPERKATP